MIQILQNGRHQDPNFYGLKFKWPQRFIQWFFIWARDL